MGFGTVKATKGGSAEQFEVAPAGSHSAVLVALIDLGTHRDTFKDKKTDKESTADYRKVLFCWELTGCKMTGYNDRNFIMVKDYRVTFTEKAGLRKMIEGWAGKAFQEGQEFDITKLLGKSFQLTLIHDHPKSNPDRTYAQISGIGPVPKGLAVAKPSITPFARDLDAPGELPDWTPYLYGEPVKDVIARSLERRGAAAPASKPISENGEPPEQHDEPEGDGGDEVLY